jgi:hypothetical protein
MDEPRFQFGISTLLLVAAFIAICIAGLIAGWGELLPAHHKYLPQIVAMFSPFWAPIVFLAYALGRRTMTAKTVLTFAVVETVAVAWCQWWMKNSPW